MKTTIVILSDPKSGSEEALGRMFNGLGAANDFKQAGEDVSIVFQGTGSRWVAELMKPDHIAHGLFEAVKDKVAGVSAACASVFGGEKEAKECGFNLLTDTAVEGTPGVASLRKYATEGRLLMF
jgi:hypothetical protein